MHGVNTSQKKHTSSLLTNLDALGHMGVFKKMPDFFFLVTVRSPSHCTLHLWVYSYGLFLLYFLYHTFAFRNLNIDCFCTMSLCLSVYLCLSFSLFLYGTDGLVVPEATVSCWLVYGLVFLTGFQCDPRMCTITLGLNQFHSHPLLSSPPAIFSEWIHFFFSSFLFRCH